MLQLFEYKARNQVGDLVSGVLRAEGESAVDAYLISLNLIPVKIGVSSQGSLRKFLRSKRGVRLEDLIIITRQMATLYRAGIPTLKSLEMVSDRYTGTQIEEALLLIRDDLERGELLSEAMSRHPAVFSPVYVASVRAAEATGRLDFVLDRLSDTLEQELVTLEEIKKATRYPLTVIVVIAAAFLFLTTWVVPRFAAFYESYDAPLPKPTVIIMALSRLMADNWYFVLPVLIAGIVATVRLIKHPSIKPKVDAFVLKTPVFGGLIVKVNMSRFAHLLSLLIASGTPMIQSFDIVRAAVGNTVIADEIGRLAEYQREGRSLLDIKNHLHHFPGLAISLIHVGMESGSLEQTLTEVSHFFDRDIRYTSSRLTSLLEPIMIVVIGVMVLCLALAIFLPMWNMISVFKG